MVKDKEIEKILGLLPKEAEYNFTKAQIPRAINENDLAAMANTLGLKGKAFEEVNIALRYVLQHCHSDDLIVICGSVFLVGEVNPVQN